MQDQICPFVPGGMLDGSEFWNFQYFYGKAMDANEVSIPSGVQAVSLPSDSETGRLTRTQSYLRVPVWVVYSTGHV
jgi:hypothetical protein